MEDSNPRRTRELNQDENQAIKFPLIQAHLLKTAPQDVMNIYWNLNQDAYFTKQTAINAFLQTPEKFRKLNHFLSFISLLLHFILLFPSNASLHRVEAVPG